MPIDVEEGTLIARNSLGNRFRDSIDLFRVHSLPLPAYGFDPSGWLLFQVHQRDSTCMHGDWIVAVHSETGELRNLGWLGD